ncbi:hypothetical protein JHK85_017055 [Glycine max]|nr:hypothetical protein JHK85_017055 [Glycine max]
MAERMHRREGAARAHSKWENGNNVSGDGGGGDNEDGDDIDSGGGTILMVMLMSVATIVIVMVVAPSGGDGGGYNDIILVVVVMERGGFAKKIGICYAFVAELWGVYEGLKLAFIEGCSCLEVQVDSKAVVASIKGGKQGCVMGVRLIVGIRQLLAQRTINVGLEAIPILLSFIAHSNMKPFLSNRFDRYMLPEKTYKESEQEV